MILDSAGLPHAAFDSAQSFIDEYEENAPGCLILDLHMPGMSGMELIQKLVDQRIDLPVIVVSGTGTIPIAVQGMKLGVKDFLEKPVHPAILLDKVHAALAADAARRTESAELDTIRKKFDSLTAREREVLQLIVDGLPNKLIARRMNISIKTVTNHRANLIEKAGAVNTADLVRMWMLIKPENAGGDAAPTSSEAAPPSVGNLNMPASFTPRS
jgi:FixJ family two-component response regulator